eukprot:gnl/TRDRNA2_/TRDRNA2_176568_c0_seq27.p1 gnl/TRDRNA2_/TRDRNA2_176568_c0~~gnl/TRDRNA2_/TRDRNA2_176568_c0_seq27.p1  ORF type:complete len:109 (-),score=1.97 gnl/TRDRNA2_/TRDRNA2_176568_c0_seq27:262-588(-)
MLKARSRNARTTVNKSQECGALLLSERVGDTSQKLVRYHRWPRTPRTLCAAANSLTILSSTRLIRDDDAKLLRRKTFACRSQKRIRHEATQTLAQGSHLLVDPAYHVV